MPLHDPGVSPLISEPADAVPSSDRGVLLGSCRVRGVELPVALLDSASLLVSGNGHADMVRASSFARSGDFLLRSAGCQGKDLIAEAWRAAIAASWFRRYGAPAPP